MLPMHKLIAGCDEVGRGCLAGPVVAAAVILSPDFPYPLLKDSKQLTPKQRVLLDAMIREEALDWAIGFVTSQEIDRINILNASHLAMHRAINMLEIRPDLLLIDGNLFKPYLNIRHQCIIRGDEQVSSIAAASIIAKVYRDRYMQELSLQVPGYAWERNMGYPTKVHRQAICDLGITAHHRKSFRQVADQLHLSLWGF
jgi:ribonuclease HII